MGDVSASRTLLWGVGTGLTRHFREYVEALEQEMTERGVHTATEHLLQEARVEVSVQAQDYTTDADPWANKCISSMI